MNVLATSTISQTSLASNSRSDIIVTTTFSQSTYTYTYLPPTSTNTASVSGTTTAGWILVPPIVPLPFPVPPVVSPPEEPETPGEPEDPEEEDPENTQRNKPTLPSLTSTACSTKTATMTVVNCNEDFWVSSYQLQSSLTDCSTSLSRTSGCIITSMTASTNTIDPSTSSITIDTDATEIDYDPGQLVIDGNPPGNATRLQDIFKNDMGVAPPPPDPPRGDLVCAAQNTTGPSFIQDNGLVSAALSSEVF